MADSSDLAGLDHTVETLHESTEHVVKRICIIGAGPVGLGALKTVKDAPEFKQGLWEVTAFEARDAIGGIWYPAPAEGDPPLTALYDSLTTNTPHPLMCYTSYPFPPATPLYPPAGAVLAYLNAFAARFELTPHIRLSSPVTGVHWDVAARKWSVTVARGREERECAQFDLVLVGNGHFRIPRIPQTKGLEAWREKGRVSHTAWYRDPADHTGDKILVVGGGYSGMDVASETRPFAREVVHSVTGATPADEDGGRIKKRGRVAEYLDVDTGRVVYEDGTTESGFDHVVLATGYQFSFPFLSEPEVVLSMPPQGPPPIPRVLYNSTYHIFPLAKHMFPLVTGYPPSSLAFLGLPLRVAPFPLVEVQTRAVLKVFADPGSLDLLREAAAVRARYERFRADKGDNKVAIADAWFRFGFDEMFDYRDELHAFLRDVYRVPQWERELFEAKDRLREQSRALARAGLEDVWLRGVGSGDDAVQEWVDLMRKVREYRRPSTPDE